MPIRIVYCLTFRALSLRQREKPDEGPTTEMLDYTIRIGSTPIYVYILSILPCIVLHFCAAAFKNAALNFYLE